MPRVFLLASLAGLTLAMAQPRPVAAQADAATRSLIERLRPQPGGATRGIRLPTDAGSATPAQRPENGENRRRGHQSKCEPEGHAANLSTFPAGKTTAGAGLSTAAIGVAMRWIKWLDRWKGGVRRRSAARRLAFSGSGDFGGLAELGRIVAPEHRSA